MNACSFIRECRSGMLEAEMTDALIDLAAGVRKTGRAGSISLTITMSPRGEGVVTVADSLSTKPPKETKETTLFFLMEDDTLSRDKPHQPDLELFKETKR